MWLGRCWRGFSSRLVWRACSTLASHGNDWRAAARSAPSSTKTKRCQRGHIGLPGLEVREIPDSVARPWTAVRPPVA